MQLDRVRKKGGWTPFRCGPFHSKAQNEGSSPHFWAKPSVAILLGVFVFGGDAHPLPGSIAQAQQPAEKKPSGKYVLVIHGGSIANPVTMKTDRKTATHESLTKALGIGKGVLEKGGTSLDAVEQVIRFLEDDPIFNAGRGAVFNAAGGHELDASIMDGSTKQCGAVAAVKTVKNPISLARLVMVKTRHVLFAAEGAEQFARQMKVEQVENSYFSTPARYDEWQKAKARQEGKRDDEDKGTVGCVALDQFGHLAAGTSTGGLTNKMFGRVGDSPIVGAGTYADDETCAVSCTGTGEQFIRHAVAYDIAAQMKYQNKSVASAVSTVLQKTLNRGDGGIIAVGHNGEFTMQYNSGGMSRAVATHGGVFEIIVGP